MEDIEFDAVLGVLENPVRRKIIKRLSQGPSYPSQLSKELGLGQPLVAKHLTMMEAAKVVTSSLEGSPSGPDRRIYSLAKSISITLDMAPNLFIQNGYSFSSVEGGELSKDATDMMNETSRISGEEEDIPALSVLLTKIDRELDKLGKQRAALLHIRNRTMRTASQAIAGVDGRERKKVIFSILDQHNSNVAYLSKTLDLREVVVRDVLKQLRSLLE